jgi:Flp pilus assembly protein TadD
MPEQTMTLDQAMNLAVQHHTAGRLAEAETIYRQILQVMPNYASALHNLGELAYRCKRYDAAIDLLKRASEIEPTKAIHQNTMAVALFSSGRPDESYHACLRALELDPQLASAHANLGICFADRGDLPASIKSFERAIELDPNNACAHDGLGLSSLMNGDLQRGWHEQEWRWAKHDFAPRRFTGTPHWKGEDLRGKTLFIYVEQGYGDVFQFCRYLPILAERGIKVLMEQPPEIANLLRTVPGNTQWITAGLPVAPVCDVACPLMSIPLWCGTTLETIPAVIPYLRANPDLVARWRVFFQSDANLKVGICWAGRPTHTNDHNRTTTLDSFAPLADVPGVTYYSLQKGPAAAQAGRPPAGMRLIDMSPRLENFDITAAMICNLDLLITVDTSLAHLAGAMGRPIWNLLPFCPDWRWMLNRPDTPWYPTMRLIRLPKRGDWQSAIMEAKLALRDLPVKPGHS